MSFIRPEIQALLPRLVEPALWTLGLAAGARLAWSGVALGAWVWLGAGLVLVAIAGAGLGAWARRARLRTTGEDVGVVTLTEGRIGYWAPEGGAFVDLDGLSAIDIRRSPGRGPVWVLHHDDGPAVAIPTAARGAERLADAIAALPGARVEAAAAALGQGPAGLVWIWKRSDADGPTLGSVAPTAPKQ